MPNRSDCGGFWSILSSAVSNYPKNSVCKFTAVATQLTATITMKKKRDLTDYLDALDIQSFDPLFVPASTVLRQRNWYVQQFSGQKSIYLRTIWMAPYKPDWYRFLETHRRHQANLNAMIFSVESHPSLHVAYLMQKPKLHRKSSKPSSFEMCLSL